MKVRLMSLVLYAAGTIVALAVLLVLAGQLGWLSGAAPENLGVRDGRLKPPSKTPNSVSSQADLHAGTSARVDYARIAPLAAGSDPAATMQRLKEVIAATPGARIVDARPDYLYAQFATRWLKFVDDTEFWLSDRERVIHVRSSSRLGRKDFGVNRARIERIRAALKS
jgi:uncharacterized protein (DUF1499 family)